MKFIHAADLHIDSPLRGLDAHEGAPVERLRGATRRAFVALVDLALAEQVDMVLLAGDIFDGDWVDFRTGLFFRAQLVRMRDAGIIVMIARGNHDAASQITRQLPEVDGVRVFSSRAPEQVPFPDLSVAVSGYSFPDRAVNEDVVPRFPKAVPGLFNIGVLHTSLTGREGHDTYAPTTVDMLGSRGYDYFALGHVHKREVVRDTDPRIVFPGNIQGRRAGEDGPKGCELVSVEDGVIVDARFVALDTVRWHQVQVDVSDIRTLEAFTRAFHERVDKVVDDDPDRMHAMRVTIVGESDLHRLEAEQPGTVAAAVAAAVQDYARADLWVERVVLALRSPIDRAHAATRADAVGAVVGLVDEIAADEDKMLTWIREQLASIGALPAPLAEYHFDKLDIQSLRTLLADAEATVLAQLGANSAEGDPQ